LAIELRPHLEFVHPQLTPPKNNPLHVLDNPVSAGATNGDIAAFAPSAESTRIAWARLLWERRAALRKAVIAGFVLSLLAVFLIPARYESKARLMPPDQSSSSGLAAIAALAGRTSGSGGGGLSSALGGGLGSVAGDLLGLKTSGALFADMLEGSTIEDDVIKQFDLRKVYGDRLWVDARKDLARRTDIKEDRKSGVISITVTDHDPRRAQQIAQAYVEALNGLVSQVSTSSARRERIFLEQRLKTVKQKLDDAARQFSEYSSKNGTLDVPSQSRAMLESEATLEGQLIAAQSELEGFQQIYTDNNIRMKTLRAKIAGLRQQIEAMSGNKADLTSDQSEIAGGLPSIRKLPLVGVQWANLYREAKIQETVYELLTQEYEFAKVQEAKEIPTVNVLDAPLLPERKSFPPRVLIIVLGTVFAFFLMSTVIIGTEAWMHNQSPEKQLATEIWSQMSANDSKSKTVAHHVWSKISGHNGSSGRKSA
jgi:capsule polysaccharide export protein KpsE/RkpR